MRRRSRLGVCLAVLSPLAFAACRTTPSATLHQETFASATIVRGVEVTAIVNVPDTAIAFDSVARVVNVRNEYNVAVAVVRRERHGDNTPPDALSHHDITEVYQIVEGSGVLALGGQIVGGAEMSANSRGVRRVVGPSVRGTAIDGGRAIDCRAGDIIVIPPDTPHGFVRLTTPRIVYTVLRIDPMRRLPVPPAARLGESKSPGE